MNGSICCTYVVQNTEYLDKKKSSVQHCNTKDKMRKLVTISFPEDLLTALDSRSEEDGKKRSSLVLQAVRLFLDGTNGPKNYSVIPEEIIQFGKDISLKLIEDINVSVKQALSEIAENPKKSETPKLTLYKAQEILVETTPGTLGSVDAFTVVQEELPIEVVKEKVSVPRGTCSECFSKGGQHQKFCSKRKK